MVSYSFRSLFVPYQYAYNRDYTAKKSCGVTADTATTPQDHDYRQLLEVLFNMLLECVLYPYLISYIQLLS